MGFIKQPQVLGQPAAVWPEPDFEPRSQKPDPEPFTPYGGATPINTPPPAEMIRHQAELTHFRWWEKFWDAEPAERRQLLEEAGLALDAVSEDIRAACEEPAPTPPKRRRLGRKKV